MSEILNFSFIESNNLDLAAADDDELYRISHSSAAEKSTQWIRRLRISISSNKRRKKRSEKFLFTFVAQQAQMASRSSSSKESPLKIELKYLHRQLHVFKFVWILNIIDSEFEIVTQAATSHRVVFYFFFPWFTTQPHCRQQPTQPSHTAAARKQLLCVRVFPNSDRFLMTWWDNGEAKKFFREFFWASFRSLGCLGLSIKREKKVSRAKFTLEQSSTIDQTWWNHHALLHTQHIRCSYISVISPNDFQISFKNSNTIFFWFFFWLSTFHAILDVLTADRVLIEHFRPENKREPFHCSIESKMRRPKLCETFFAESLEGVKIFHMNSAEKQRNSPEDSAVWGWKFAVVHTSLCFFLSPPCHKWDQVSFVRFGCFTSSATTTRRRRRQKNSKFLRLVPGRNRVCIDGVKLNQRAQLLRKMCDCRHHPTSCMIKISRSELNSVVEHPEEQHNNIEGKLIVFELIFFAFVIQPIFQTLYDYL